MEINGNIFKTTSEQDFADKSPIYRWYVNVTHEKNRKLKMIQGGLQSSEGRLSKGHPLAVLKQHHIRVQIYPFKRLFKKTGVYDRK